MLNLHSLGGLGCIRWPVAFGGPDDSLTQRLALDCAPSTDVLRGLHRLPTARAIADLIRKKQETPVSVSVASSSPGCS